MRFCLLSSAAIFGSNRAASPHREKTKRWRNGRWMNRKDHRSCHARASDPDDLQQKSNASEAVSNPHTNVLFWHGHGSLAPTYHIRISGSFIPPPPQFYSPHGSFGALMTPNGALMRGQHTHILLMISKDTFVSRPICTTVGA